MEKKVKIHDEWYALLQDEFEKPYFGALTQTLKQEKAQGKVIFPPGPLIFNAFENCLVSQLKVVILGQDPYHGFGQAHGLSFSVPTGVDLPPSLKNIFKELASDLNVPTPQSGNLEKWAKQGVLLLNASLTVVEKSPMSHAKIGWEIFTDAVIQKISENHPHVVFILWGGFARGKKKLIASKHTILESAHPSPLSAYNGFFGSKPFSKCNFALEQKGLAPIDWVL